MAIWAVTVRRRKDPGKNDGATTQPKSHRQDRLSEKYEKYAKLMKQETSGEIVISLYKCNSRTTKEEIELADITNEIVGAWKQKSDEITTDNTHEGESHKQQTKPPTNTAVKAATSTPIFRLIVRSRRFPDPKYLSSIQPGGKPTLRCFARKAKQTIARASTACPTPTTAMAMLIGAKPEAKNSIGVDSNSVAKIALKNTTAPANQQDSTTALLPERYLNFSDRTLGATLRADHYAAFRRPPPTYDKSNRPINVPIGPTAENFNSDRTLGATLRAEHYAAFRRPPPA